MTLSNTIREQIIQAMKSGDTFARDVLKYAVSEIQAAQSRAKNGISEEDEQRIIRKIIIMNEANFEYADSEEKLDTLKKENEILTAFLPAMMDAEEIIELLNPHHPDIKNCPSDGQAIGIAMKALKGGDKKADGNMVVKIVKEIRSDI
jgi:uncharacterized protein